ncbi:hypothetical protein DFH09DRAFT_1365563 [Mycena vulgaris]|nr:hypothetical protein DFH09DRAFT_1365563 [Mycena vulgaris]
MTSDALSSLSDSNTRYIFQFLEDAELYDLSMTSPRMHKLALSVLLARRNIANPLDSAVIHLGDQSNTVQVLRIALFVPSIKHLSIWFSPGVPQWVWPPSPPLTLEQLEATATDLFREMVQLRRLLKKLKSIDGITLILPGSLEWNLRNVNLERGSTSDVFSWSPILFCLQEILEKQCISFGVEASPVWMHAPLLPRPDNASGHRLLRKLLKRRRATDMSALDGSKYRPHKSPVIHAGNHITTFSITTTLLFFPGCAGWTFSVLKRSPIVTLHISGLNISRSDWDQVASKLAGAVPNLIELDFDDRQISPDCLMWMLNRLSRLTILTIGRHTSVYPTRPRILPPFSAWYLPEFRFLTKLSAHTSYVSLFLMRRNPLSALTVLTLPPTIIHRIITKHHEPFYIHIPGIIRRLRDINHGLSPLPVTIFMDGKFPMLSLHIDASLALDPGVLDSLREITHLVLEDFNSLTDAQSLSRWLRLFPSLRSVSWQDLDNERAARANISHLAREISRACPKVEAITAQGVRYNLSSIFIPVEMLGKAVLTFCDLPTEVLLCLFDFLNAELFWLSLVCRRLHFLALPIFLTRNFIADPCEAAILDIGAMYDPDLVMRGLTVALFVPSIKHLVSDFPTPIQRATRLIRKLATVEKLSLDFAYNNYRLEHVSWDGAYQERRIWEACYSILSDLLNQVHAKSCTSLTVFGSPATSRSSVMFIPIPSTAHISSITTLSVDVDRSADSYSWWIFMALRHSTITSLHLTVTDSTNLESIAAASSALEVLSIDGDHAPVKGILEYLAKCPRVTTLTLEPYLSRDALLANLEVEGPRLYFDDLVDLAAPVSYISYLFHACDHFPALERLRVFVDRPHDVGWSLTSLIEGVRERYPLLPAITLEIMTPAYTASFHRSLASTSFLGGKWMHAARHIVGLGVQWHPDWSRPGEMGVIDPDVMPLLVNWFSLFKGARNISIQGCYMAPSDSLVELGPLPTCLFLYDSSLMGFADALAAQGGQVRKLDVRRPPANDPFLVSKKSWDTDTLDWTFPHTNNLTHLTHLIGGSDVRASILWDMFAALAKATGGTLQEFIGFTLCVQRDMPMRSPEVFRHLTVMRLFGWKCWYPIATVAPTVKAPPSLGAGSKVKVKETPFFGAVDALSAADLPGFGGSLK